MGIFTHLLFSQRRGLLGEPDLPAPMDCTTNMETPSTNPTEALSTTITAPDVIKITNCKYFTSAELATIAHIIGSVEADNSWMFSVGSFLPKIKSLGISTETFR